jgi:predicted nucleotidyltransferase component of viral defense system
MEIKNEAQLRRAVLEDEAVDLVAKNYGGFVMHGGTAVWRCYGGNRFSRDVDFYSNLDASKESALQKNIHTVLVENGYSIREEKYNNETLTLHIIFRGNDTTGKLDITFRKVRGHAVEYLRVDGAKKMINALAPEALLDEKMDAYLSRYGRGTEEIHDLYDIIILKDKIGKPTKEIRRKIGDLIEKIRKRPPKNEKDLASLILDGVAPNFADMISMLERWLDETGR